MKKPRLPSEAHAKVIKAHGMKDYLYEVMHDNGMSITVRHRITGEFKVLEKNPTKQ